MSAVEGWRERTSFSPSRSRSAVAISRARSSTDVGDAMRATIAFEQPDNSPAATRTRGQDGVAMDFRRVDALPPYAFAEVERLKLELRRAGEDVIDLGFGNPDVAPPEVAVEKLREAAPLPRTHRYSSSRGLPKLREAICDLYRDRFGVDLDPETEATLTLGSKGGLVHLLWVLLGPGDVALVPSPSYPIHLFAPGF